MQQLSVIDYYNLGKRLNQIEHQIGSAETPMEARSIAWPLFMAKWGINQLLVEPCALLSGSKRAAKAIVNAIEALIPQEVDEIFSIPENDVFQPYQLGNVRTAIANFETVLKNDMPEMSTFSVFASRII